MPENDFVLMTAGQVWPEGVITAIVISTILGDEMTANTFVQLSFLLGSEQRFLDEQTTQAFRTHSNPNKDLVFEFRFSEFNDRLYRGDVRHQTDTIIVESGV